MSPIRSGCAIALAFFWLPGPSRAALPDEIQVYTSDIDKPGEFGLELHVNTTPSGRSTPDYPGEIPPAHGWRFTGELSYGVTPALEAGLYLPFVLGAGDRDRFAGPKARLKWLPVRVDDDGNGAFAGLNFEYAWTNPALEQATQALEVRPIVGWRNADWLLAFNPVLGFDRAGPAKGHAPAFEPSLKAGRTVARGVMAGLEYYAGLGPANDLLPRSQQEHSLYLAFDVDRAPWVFNVGVGRGLTSATDRWTVKAIFEIPL